MDETLEDQLTRLGKSREASVAQTHLDTAHLLEENAEEQRAAGNTYQADVDTLAAQSYRHTARLWANRADKLAAKAEQTDTRKD